MYTLGSTTVNKFFKSEPEPVAHSFACDAAIAEGIMVKLKSDGTITACAAVTDIPIGHTVTAGAAAGDKVTVLTIFSSIHTCTTDGTVAIGARVSQSGVITDGSSAKMKTSVTTNIVSGIALEGATTGNLIKVGILRGPYLLTIA